MRHHLFSTLRQLRRQPLISLIQLIGLTIGFICFIGGFGTARYWSLSDRQYSGSERTYILTQSVTYRGTPRSGASISAAYHVARHVRADIPQLDAVARAVNWSMLPVSAAGRTLSLRLAGADADFPRMFSVPRRTPLDDTLRAPRSALLTTEAAQRLFGSTEVVGRTLRLNNQVDLTVAGIFDPQQPSHIGAEGQVRFELLVSWDVIEQLVKATDPAIADTANEIWFAGCCVTYVRLPADGSVTTADLQRRLDELIATRVPASQRAFADIVLGVAPLNAVRATELERVLFANSGIEISLHTALLLLAAAVLVIACVNYANLASAQVLSRAGQIGMYRILGAGRWMLAGQAACEALFACMAAVGLALLTVAAAATQINQWLAVDLRVVAGDASFWMTLGWVTLLCAAGASSYPAFVAFVLRPQAALRSIGGDRVGSGAAKSVARSLVAVQFAVASMLISIVGVIYFQHQELKELVSGGSSAVVAITNNLRTAGVSFEALKAELQPHAQIKSISAVDTLPWDLRTSRNPLSRTTDGSNIINAYGNTVWYDYFATMDMQLLAGRVFSPQYNDLTVSMNASPTTPNSIVIDLALCEQLGFVSPQAAVGQLLYVSNPFAQSPQSLRVIGVVQNKSAHFVGGGTTSNSYALHSSVRFALISISSRDIAGALAAIDQAWSRLAPRSPVRRQFVQELFDTNYRIFERIGRAFTMVALLALAIAGSGLLGMAMHVLRGRMHEIGVRKTLGASAARVLGMLLADFSKPVLIANIVAFPLALTLAQIYRSIFIHQTQRSLTPFLISLCMTILFAWIGIGVQALRAARRKPALVLRSE